MVVTDLTEHPAPVTYDRGLFLCNEFSIFVDLPIDIHTAVVYITYIGLITQGRDKMTNDKKWEQVKVNQFVCKSADGLETLTRDGDGVWRHRIYGADHVQIEEKVIK